MENRSLRRLISVPKQMVLTIPKLFYVFYRRRFNFSQSCVSNHSNEGIIENYCRYIGKLIFVVLIRCFWRFLAVGFAVAGNLDALIRIYETFGL